MSRLTLISSLLVIIAFVACQQTEEGCLDLLANNYNFEAVTECDSCCTYPDAILNFRVDYDTVLSRGLIDTFYDENRDTIFLHDIQLATGAFSFVSPNGPFRILDSLPVGDTFVKDDFVLARLLISYTLGQVRFAGETNSVDFSVGIDAAEVSSWGNLDNIAQDSQLDNLLDSMYIAETQEVAMLRMNLQLADSIRQLIISTPEALNLSYPLNKFTEFSEDLSFNLRVDLNILTEELSPLLTNEEIEDLISDKIASAITIE